MTYNYIAAYYQAIKDGSIAVGKWIVIWYEQIIAGLQAGKYSYSAKKASAAILFIENFCRHHEGSLGGKKIKLELWQKALVSVLFGILDADGNRQFREAVIIIGRKNGKTLLAAAIGAYCAFLDGEYGARVYFAAPKLEQADLCFSAFNQIVDKEPSLAGLSQKRRTDIYVPSTNTKIQPLAFSAKKSDGLNPSLAVADEIASWQGEPGIKFYEVIKSAFGARRQPLLLSISTAGYVNDGIYDELMKRCTRVLLGDSKETRLAPFLYTIDDLTRWNDINELAKANPNLGVSMTVDYLLEEIAIAEQSLTKRAEFICKYCNIKQNSSVAWLSTQDVEKCCGAAEDLAQFSGCYCVGGVDLSRTTDLTACTAVIEVGGILHVFTHFFLPAERLEEAKARDGLPYDIYVKRGFLTLSGDNVVDYKDCENWFTTLRTKYKIYCMVIGYDRYSAQYLVQDLKNAGYSMDDVYQGTNLTPVIREAEGLIRDGKITVGDNDLMKIHMLGSALKAESESDRVKLVKIRANEHIDGMASLLDALTVRQKWYKDYGRLLSNPRKK